MGRQFFYEPEYLFYLISEEERMRDGFALAKS
jgi:hypothetical protein